MQEQPKEKIKGLIEKYEKAKSSGILKSYSEEETKKGFIEPLFEILGWNISEKKEVSLEETISSKRVDYGFYLDERIKFYLEAKKFNVDLYSEDFANQAVRYSFNKGAVWSVLTNFETLIIFNAQDIERKLADKKLLTIHYSEYVDKFDKLWLLSKEAFGKDLLDRYGEEVGKKTEKVPISSLLYKDLQKCREILIKDLSQWNKNVNSDDLDEGVQKILDRLLFIRVAEDREIEPSILRPMVREYYSRKEQKGTLYQMMIEKFRELDTFYNSNLFSKHPFENWEEYGATAEVINTLYGKEGYYEYDFKAMPADVLGAVYENYLSHRLSKSRKGTTVSKDASKRKEQGIYYTPSYIVAYIVKNTLGPVLDKCKTIEDIKKIKVLDPACGSGSFLIKVIDIIVDKYKEFGQKGNDNLLKIQILEENIYGVDLDPQAVEITRLNLIINALNKREKFQPLGNIKNGNSLTFNWQDEFPEVFKHGGFDVIIGNPPYIKEFVSKNVFGELHNSPYYQGKMDIWTMFACISIDLLKNNGLLSFIAPNNWVTNAGASIFRDKVLKDGELKTFVDFGDYKVFEHAGIQTMIFVFEKKKPGKNYKIDYLKIADKNLAEDKLIADIFGQKVKINIEPENLIGKSITFSTTEQGYIFDKIRSKKNFEFTEKEVGQGIVAPQESVIKSHLSIMSGISLGEGIFVLSGKDIDELGLLGNDKKILKPFYTPEQINKYYVQPENKYWIIYTTSKLAKEVDKYPKIKQHLEKFKNVITSAFGPFGLHRAREERFFIGPSIFSIRKTDVPRFSYVDFPCYVSQTYFVINTSRCNLKYLTGLLNSQLINFWLHGQGKLQGDMLQIDKEPLLNIPIYIGNKKQQKQVIILVDKMLKLNKDFKEAAENSEKWNSIKSEIEKIDKKIDQEVYRLYDLTEAEIKIVENNK
ncbi:N-6 DNA methylase [Patescibacteria group bacterium]|nr:N-6 DNA methylase [Patescibacteria group bacterium]